MRETAGNALVLTAPPGELRSWAVQAAQEALSEGFFEARWLAPEEAWEAQFAAASERDCEPLLAGLRGIIGGSVDFNVVVGDRAQRRKKLLVADMDSTMIEQECIDELADFAGLKSHVAAITDRAMRGEIAFEPALRERVALLKGLPTTVIDEVLRERITLMPGGKTLVSTMRAHGATACLVSGGFVDFVERIATAIGFDTSRANVLEVDDGKLAGRVREPILGREAKLATLIAERDARGLSPSETMAVGDGANDLAMLGEAGLGVAYHAKPAVAQAAAARVDHCDLTALLYLQGYSRNEFVG